MFHDIAIDTHWRLVNVLLVPLYVLVLKLMVPVQGMQGIEKVNLMRAFSET